MTEKTRHALLVAAAVVIPGGIAAALLWALFRRRGRHLTDDELVREAAAQLTKWEGAYGHLYLDTKGLPTTGVGNLVKLMSDVAKLPWAIGGRPAALAEVARDFAAVAAAAPARPAKSYAALTQIRLSDGAVAQLLEKRLRRDFLPLLHGRFPNWEKLPGKAQLALVDMIYSLGPGAFDKYRTMTHAVQRGDFRAAALASQRTGARESRNDLVRDLFYSAAGKAA